MSAPSVCFFTPIGGATAVDCRAEYNYLLGSLTHHLRLGRYLVLDTSPTEFRFEPRGLPPSVRWLHEPVYGHGKPRFRLGDALNRALEEARTWSGAEVLVYLDGDEFLTDRAVEALFVPARTRVVCPTIVHWDRTPAPYHFHAEHHVRVLPARTRGAFSVRNEAWVRHPSYDGNPQRHSIFQVRDGTPWTVVDEPIHHHIRGAVGPKGHGSMRLGERLDPARFPWPKPLADWKSLGREPLEGYS